MLTILKYYVKEFLNKPNNNPALQIKIILLLKPILTDNKIPSDNVLQLYNYFIWPKCETFL